MPIRVLLCKSGLDEHDRGIRYLSRRLLEAGMEVIYVVFHDPREVASAAVDEDVDLIGISSSAGGHVAVVDQVRSDLQSLGSGETPILLGGVIPDADRPRLTELGVLEVFGPGSSPQAVIRLITSTCRP